MKRHEIRRVFKRNRGSLAELARRSGVKAASVSYFLKNRFDSQRLEQLALAYCSELLAREQAAAAQREQLPPAA